MSPTILDKIENYLGRYMAFPDSDTTGDQSLAISLWAIHTWTFSESFPRSPWVTPYLYIGSPVKQCGKSLLIELLEPIVLNPAKMIGMTTSVLFRLIEARRPALLIDEADTIWTGGGSANEEMRGVLNGGYKHGGYIWRNAPGPDGPEPQQFSTFCPKLIAGIDNGKLPETIADRAFPIMLRRKRPDQERETYYSFMAGPEAEKLSQEIDEWVRKHGEKMIAYIPKPIPGINPRSFEISVPLLQIAHVLGIEKRVREMVTRLLAPRPDKESPGVVLLRSIRDIYDTRNADKLHTETIVSDLGSGWNGKLFANKLRPFEITPSTTLNIGNRPLKGYYRHQFEDAWERYL